MTPSRPAVTMTLGQLFAHLAKQAETWTEQEKREFRGAWIAGAKKLNAETERLRDERFLRSVGIRRY